MNIQLSDHFTYKKLFRFTAPSIMMMIFTSIYGIVDGFFVSNYVGKTPYTAVNFIMPVIMIFGALGSMLGTGGSALIAKTLGEGDSKKAQKLFSLFIYVTVGLGVIVSVFGIIFLPSIASLLGADGELLDDCVTYGRILIAANTAYMLQFEFQSFFSTAEKPQMGLFVTIIAGVTNMVLDFLFVAVFPFGLVGAAVATAISQVIGGIVPAVYFASKKNSSLLKLTKTSFDGQALLKAATNGSSEFLSNISMSVVSMLYNIQLMKYAGNDGVAAYGTLMYVNLIFIAAFIGYSLGTAPIFGFNFGSGNHTEMKSLFKKSITIISATSVLMVAASLILSRPLSLIFVKYDQDLLEMTLHAFKIYSFSFLFAGFPIFASAFFTALNNGVISAAISFLRTLVFQVAAVLVLPVFFELDGIWASIIVAEFAALIVSLIFWITQKKNYHY